MDVEYDDPRTEWMDLNPPVDPPETPAYTFGELFKLVVAAFRPVADHQKLIAEQMRKALAVPSTHIHVHVPRMSGKHFTWTVPDDFMLWPPPLFPKPHSIRRLSRCDCYGKKKADRVDIDYVMGLPVTYATEVKLKSIPVPIPPGKAALLHTKPVTEQRRRR